MKQAHNFGMPVEPWWHVLHCSGCRCGRQSGDTLCPFLPPLLVLLPEDGPSQQRWVEPRSQVGVGTGLKLVESPLFVHFEVFWSASHM